MQKLLLAFPEGTITDQQLDQLRQVAPDLEVLQTADETRLHELVADCEIIAGSFPTELLPKATQLRWFQQWSAGADWLLDCPEAQEMDFVLTNASGVHAIPISEHIIAFLLAAARNLPAAWQGQQQKQWLSGEVDDKNDKQDDGKAKTRNGKQAQALTYGRGDVFEVAGKTLLLIGVGEIGERTAKIAKALEMRIIALRHNPAEEAPYADETVGADELLNTLPEADVVISTAPLTDETKGMFNAEAFAAMKPSSYFINIGRGETVDEEALIDALQSGKIAGAALDVFETEPLPAASPLWTMANVQITPHASGTTPHYNDRAFAILLENLKRYVAGQELKNVVDKAKGY